MLDNIIQAIIFTTGIAGAALTSSPKARSRFWGFLALAIGQPAWFYVNWTGGYWGMLALWCFYSVTTIRGMYSNRNRDGD